MRFNVDEELAELREWYRDDPAFVRGACWALSRFTGVPGDVLERRVLAAPSDGPVAAPLLPATPEPALSPPHIVADAPLGIYPGIGPITRLADPLTPANMDEPPTAPSADSMAAAFERARAEGNPAALPMDEETLAAVEAELAAVRPHANPGA